MSKQRHEKKKAIVSADVFKTFTSQDKRILSSINRARDAIRDSTKKKDSFTLPSCAATPYYRPVITSVAQQKRAAGPIILPKVRNQHSSTSCEILGDISCHKCHQNRIKKMGETTSGSKLPELSSRYLGGVKELKNMTKYGSFEPVIPLYHYMGKPDKLEYYCPWIQSFRKEINLPIITRHELLHRIRYRKRSNGDDESIAINSADNLPLVKPRGVVMASRPGSIITPVPVPANSGIQTPCLPDDFMPQPPVIEIWRQWHDHHIHV